jgi:mannose-6-phosphate isomerase-like protein (cupin superfamily)
MKILIQNITEKFESFNDFWSPKIIAELNGQHVKLARLKGEFVRHKHEDEDELFWVIEGVLKIKLDDALIVLKAGEVVTIPKGVYHQPIADEEVKVVLFEPATTLNTGDASNSNFTVNNLERFDK